MRKCASYTLALVAVGAAGLKAQEAAPGACSTPESIIVTGYSRVDSAAIRSTSALSMGSQLSVTDIQTAIKALYATGQFDDVQLVCRVEPGTGGKATLVIQVRERPILTAYKVIGVDRVSPKDVKEILAFPTGAPLDPGKIAKAIASADSLYESKGYYLAHVKPESTIVDGKLSINFNVDEGRRLAISGIRINGNSKVSDADVVGAMDRAEGFLGCAMRADDAKYDQDSASAPPLTRARSHDSNFRTKLGRGPGEGADRHNLARVPRYTVGNRGDATPVLERQIGISIPSARTSRPRSPRERLA